MITLPDWPVLELEREPDARGQNNTSTRRGCQRASLATLENMELQAKLSE